MKSESKSTFLMLLGGTAFLMLCIFSSQIMGGHPVEAAKGADLNRRVWEKTGSGAVDYQIDTGKSDLLIYEIRFTLNGDVNTGPLTVAVDRAAGYTDTWVEQNLGEGENAGPIFDAQVTGLLFAGPRYLGPHETLHITEPPNGTTYNLTIVGSQL